MFKQICRIKQDEITESGFLEKLQSIECGITRSSPEYKQARLLLLASLTCTTLYI